MPCWFWAGPLRLRCLPGRLPKSGFTELFSILSQSRPACLRRVLITGFGSKWVVLASIICLTIATLGIVSTGPGFTLFGLVDLPGADTGGLFGTPAEKAYIAYGLLIGLAFGPIQASSRSWLARSVSREESGRYFGLYALAGRVTSFLAPLMVGIVTSIFFSQRAGMSVILIFLIVGFFIARGTPYPAAQPGRRGT